MPPQPQGIWNSVYNESKWTDAKGPDRYRRAVYTFIKRTAGYPSALMFDASDRDVSLPRRIATNTPLQALVTLNDPVYKEAAEALARKVAHDTEAANAENAEDRLNSQLAYEARPGLVARSDQPRDGGAARLLQGTRSGWTALRPW